MHSPARTALACLDLTSLGEDDTPATVAALARKANSELGKPAALCVYPELILAARMSLLREGIPEVRVATVVNFPEGADDPLRAERETRRALAAGADEIDLVFPYRAFLEGRWDAARAVVAAVAARTHARARLKLILESAAFPDAASLRAACELAIHAGADFLKTSTGKHPAGGASEAAVQVLADAIRSAGGQIGLKVSGGVRTLAQAERYLAIASALYGAEHVVPTRFRIGASALIDELLSVLAQEPGE
jgi:deoxyribose-phosphate aldolase